MEVVLDTNIIVSGLFFDRKPGRIVDLVLSGQLVPCFILTTWQELERVLNHPKFAQQRANLPFTIEEFLLQLETRVRIFLEPKEIVHIIPDDPADDYVLACAVLSAAQCVVSGDQHLLRLKMFNKVPIMTPDQFLKWYVTQN